MAKLPSLQSLPQARRELRTAELPTGFLADSPVPAVCLLGGFGGEPPALRPAAELGARQAKPPSRGCDSSPHAVASFEVLTAAWTFSATSSESQTASRLRVVSVTGTLPLRSRFSELIERLKRAEVQAVQSVKLQLRRESVVSSAPPWLWQLGGWREVGDSKLPGLGGRPRQSPSLSLSLSLSLSTTFPSLQGNLAIRRADLGCREETVSRTLAPPCISVGASREEAAGSCDDLRSGGVKGFAL